MGVGVGGGVGVGVDGGEGEGVGVGVGVGVAEAEGEGEGGGESEGAASPGAPERTHAPDEISGPIFEMVTSARRSSAVPTWSVSSTSVFGSKPCV